MKRRLVLAAHADDETIGCGGTIAKYAAAGGSVYVGVLTRDPDDDCHAIRQEEAKEAWQRLGVAAAEWALEPAHPLTVSSSSVGAVADWLRKFAPDVVFIPHQYEQDPDHKIVSQLVRSAMLYAGVIRHMLAYEVWTPISCPHLYEDITRMVDVKSDAINRYSSQVGVRNYASAAIALNRFRGIMTGNGTYVEAFQMMGM